MRRREFIAILGGAAAMWPLAASAQQADQVRRIGVLSNIGGERSRSPQSMVTALHEELRKLGWTDGRNLRVDHRWAAGNPERATAFAKELVALKPEVIVGHTTPSVIALQKQTRHHDYYLFCLRRGHFDPIGSGSMTMCGWLYRNITGSTNFEVLNCWRKWLKSAKRWRPASRGWHFYSIRKRRHTSPDYHYQGDHLETSARRLGLQSVGERRPGRP